MTSPAPDLQRGPFMGPDAPDESELYKCVHCGFCLQACPTYLETGLETESPRGRIALMKAVNEGRITMTPTVTRHWDLCIQCRACEVACPSGVPYGNLIEATMSEVRLQQPAGILARFVSHVSLNRVLIHQRRLRAAVAALRLYQVLGVQWLLRKTGLLRLVSGRLAEMEGSLPKIGPRRFSAKGQVVAPVGERRKRVALLSGCVMPLVHGPEMEAVTRVLARNGCEVVVPRAQRCCGAINSHVGDLDTARSLARLNVDAFLEADVEAVVVASAGCGSRMKEYGHLLRADARYAGRARRLGAMVEDVHELLAGLPLDPPKASLDYRVTYQDSCHLANPQRVTEQPRDLLRAVPGIELVELPGASVCCGGGGTYTITEREFSLRVLESKMAAVRETGADVLVTANPGCVLQLQYGAARHETPVRVRYVTDILDEAYRRETAHNNTVMPA